MCNAADTRTGFTADNRHVFYSTRGFSSELVEILFRDDARHIVIDELRQCGTFSRVSRSSRLINVFLA